MENQLAYYFNLGEERFFKSLSFNLSDNQVVIMFTAEASKTLAAS